MCVFVRERERDRPTVSKELIFPTDENGGKDIARNKEQEKHIVELGMMSCVKHGQENQANRADDSEHDGQRREDLLAPGGIGHQSATVSEPAVGQKRDIEEDAGDDAPRDEERFKTRGADVADVGNSLLCVHRAVVPSVFGYDPVEQES